MDYVRLTGTLTLRLLLVLLGLVAATWLFWSLKWAGFVLVGVLACLVAPLLLVVAVAWATRRPVTALPRWFLVVGGMCTIGFLLSFLAGVSNAQIIGFALGVWLLLVGGAAALTVGIWKLMV